MDIYTNVFYNELEIYATCSQCLSLKDTQASNTDSREPIEEYWHHVNFSLHQHTWLYYPLRHDNPLQPIF
jgi:hypothetical protein